MILAYNLNYFRSVLVGCGSMILISCIGAVTGLAMYAVYHSCDPFLHKVRTVSLQNVHS